MNTELLKRISVIFHTIREQGGVSEVDEMAFTDWLVDLLNVFEPDANRRIWYSMFAVDPNADDKFPRFED